jgi:antitoxin component of MazEF toxin-antitoxin module
MRNVPRVAVLGGIELREGHSDGVVQVEVGQETVLLKPAEARLLATALQRAARTAAHHAPE